MTDRRIVEAGIEIQVPVNMAYDQWTQFETFPTFLPNIDEVRQVDDVTLDWKAKVGMETLSWRARITEQIPDKRIAWKSIQGYEHAGVVTFHRLSDGVCRVMVQLSFVPSRVIEKIGSQLGIAQSLVLQNLKGFKQFLEERGESTGAWRGSVPSKEERR